MFNLQEILESKHEPEVLSFFLLAPPRSFYFEELSKRLGLNRLKLEPIVSKMAQSGQLKVFTKKGKKYYILKAGFKPFPELKLALTKNKLAYTDEFWHAFSKLGNLKGVFLSGLFVGHPDLPVDILLVGKVSPQALKEFLENAGKMSGQELNYTLMTEEEFTIRRDTFDRFIKDIFDYPHLVVFDNIGNKKSKKG